MKNQNPSSFQSLAPKHQRHHLGASGGVVEEAAAHRTGDGHRAGLADAADAHAAVGRRWSNEKNPGRYITQVMSAGTAVIQAEDIDERKAAGEFLFLGLRMTEGILVRRFVERFGNAPWQIYPKISDWIQASLLEETADRLRFTPKGLMVANSMFVELM